MDEIKRHNLKKFKGDDINSFKDFGFYSDDPEEDKMINVNLIKFLGSKGYPRPRIQIIKKKK